MTIFLSIETVYILIIIIFILIIIIFCIFLIILLRLLINYTNSIIYSIIYSTNNSFICIFLLLYKEKKLKLIILI